jgi:hypothetical protein
MDHCFLCSVLWIIVFCVVFYGSLFDLLYFFFLLIFFNCMLLELCYYNIVIAYICVVFMFCLFSSVHFLITSSVLSHVYLRRFLYNNGMSVNLMRVKRFSLPLNIEVSHIEFYR